MKTIEQITFGKDVLTVLVESKDGKGYVEYFLNGYQISEWDKIQPIFQNLFTVLADYTCDNLLVPKWSY